MLNQCEFRFYEELNDFLPPGLRKRSFPYRSVLLTAFKF